MPHRHPELHSFFTHAAEGTLLGLLAVWQGAEAIAAAISEQDWQKAFGPNGVAFVSVVAVVVLWGALLAFIHRTKKDEEKRRAEEIEARNREDEARERRHKEIMDLQNKNWTDLKELTAESIKAGMRGTYAVENLVRQLGERPCQADSFKPYSQPCPATVNNPQ